MCCPQTWWMGDGRLGEQVDLIRARHGLHFTQCMCNIGLAPTLSMFVTAPSFSDIGRHCAHAYTQVHSLCFINHIVMYILMVTQNQRIQDSVIGVHIVSVSRAPWQQLN